MKVIIIGGVAGGGSCCKMALRSKIYPVECSHGRIINCLIFKKENRP